MKVIGQIREIYGKEYLPLLEQCAPGFYKNKSAVVEYLRNGEVVAVAAGSANDVITGEKIPGTLATLANAEYAWRSDVAHYVERYGLNLSEDFLESIHLH